MAEAEAAMQIFLSANQKTAWRAPAEQFGLDRRRSAGSLPSTSTPMGSRSRR